MFAIEEKEANELRSRKDHPVCSSSILLCTSRCLSLVNTAEEMGSPSCKHSREVWPERLWKKEGLRNCLWMCCFDRREEPAFMSQRSYCSLCKQSFVLILLEWRRKMQLHSSWLHFSCELTCLRKDLNDDNKERKMRFSHEIEETGLYEEKPPSYSENDFFSRNPVSASVLKVMEGKQQCSLVYTSLGNYLSS